MKRRVEEQAGRSGEQGMALLITVMVVSLLIAVTLQYHQTTWQQYLVASDYETRVRLKAIADSGVNMAMALLQKDFKDNQVDSLLDSWAVVGQEPFAGDFPSGSLRLQVVDLSGRLPVNSLVEAAGGGGINEDLRDVLLRLLMSGAFVVEEEAEARAIVDGLIDWLDPDDQESDLGAESSYYQSLAKPYGCRNGPVRYIEELLLVRGVSPALLFGAEGKTALADYLTVDGDQGKLNLNTAPLLLIKSLDPLIGEDILMKLDEYRKDRTHEQALESVDWYRSIDGWPGDIVLNDAILTTTSEFFQITATGYMDTRLTQVVAVVARSGDGELRLLRKKTE